MKSTLLALGLSALAATSVAAQQTARFDWQGRLDAGRTIAIHGVNGDIRAMPSQDGTVRVTADRHGRRSNPRDVRIEVLEHADGVTICAVYPTPSDARRENECRVDGARNSTKRNDVQVDWIVRVPAGVLLEAQTVNGSVEIDDLESDARVSTVNGSVDVRTSGFAEARTVNGNVTCRLGDSTLPDDVKFETVNGSILVEMPEGLNAELRASTVNGSIESDFPILVSGKVSPRSMRGTIGNGGHQLHMTTVNGSIRIRRM